ncbi:MAG: hypothetical protein VX747_09300, partial [Actinomycetota bacterium]|nr:hypothetical protein [Actinomycetota bacterium]
RADGAPEGAIPLDPYAGVVRITTPSGAASPALTGAVDTLVARIKARAAKGPKLRRAGDTKGAADPSAEGAATLPSAHKRHAEAEQTSALELWLALALVAMMLWTVPVLVRRCWRGLLTEAAPIGPLPAWAVLVGLLALVAVVQLFFVPRELVTVFAGYGAVNEAWALRPVIKYGAATTALYGPLLGFFGPSTDVFIATNRVFGLLTVLCAGALARRMGGGLVVGLVAIALTGLLPALLRDRASESILVPMSFWVLASMVHLDRWREDGCRGHLVATAVMGALALHARPEVWVVLPLLWIAALSLTPGARRPHLVIAGTLALAAPRLWSLIHYTSAASQSGDVPGLSDGAFAGFVERFLGLNSLWWPEVFPLSAGLLALAALVLVPRASRLAVGLLLVASVVWQALSTLDLPEVSAPRT